jgi:hypothetical protein
VAAGGATCKGRKALRPSIWRPCFQTLRLHATPCCCCWADAHPGPRPGTAAAPLTGRPQPTSSRPLQQRAAAALQRQPWRLLKPRSRCCGSYSSQSCRCVLHQPARLSGRLRLWHPLQSRSQQRRPQARLLERRLWLRRKRACRPAALAVRQERCSLRPPARTRAACVLPAARVRCWTGAAAVWLVRMMRCGRWQLLLLVAVWLLRAARFHYPVASFLRPSSHSASTSPALPGVHAAAMTARRMRQAALVVAAAASAAAALTSAVTWLAALAAARQQTAALETAVVGALQPPPCCPRAVVATSSATLKSPSSVDALGNFTKPTLFWCFWFLSFHFIFASDTCVV